MPRYSDPRLRGNAKTNALVGGLVSALALGAAMLVLRASLQVRSIPERLVEWLLLFVPPSLFEFLVQRMSFDAKRYALDLGIVVILGLSGWLGYVVLLRGWSPRAIALLGVSLWLIVMLVVMPLTSAGIFALALLDGKRAAIGGYLAVSMTYAATLGLLRQRRLKPQTSIASRRFALGLVGGAAVSYVATYLGVMLLPHAQGIPSVVLDDSEPNPPTASADSQAPHPGVVPDAPVVVSLPEPDITRELVRNKDGAVVPSSRPPGQLVAPITSNRDFYVVTKNPAGDPLIHPSDWHLVVDGEIAQPFKLDYATLRRLPVVEITKTLECISNFVGKPELAPFGAELISTAVWKGVAVRDVLGLVGGPTEAATWVVAIGADEYTSAVPLEVSMDPATLLVYEMNGEVLPLEHGYPARLLVPGRYGLKNPKWLTGLHLTSGEVDDWYGKRSWSKTAIVETMCRLDSPAPDAQLPVGTHEVSGIAYAGTRGIQLVEFSLDAGKRWRAATMTSAGPGEDRWVAWRGEFELAPEQDLTIMARATDGSGTLQPRPFRLPEPDGGSGWAEVSVRAAR